MKTRALLLTLPLLAIALGGCRDNRASVSVHGICTVTAACTFSGKCDAFLAGNPAVDAVNSAGGLLTLFLEVENQLTDNSQAETFRTNTNDAHVDEIIVEYQGIALPRQVVGTQQRVPTAGTAVIGVDVVPASAANAAVLAAYAPTTTPREMTAVIKFGGYFDDGSRFETGDFPVAVDVCSACISPCASGVACGAPGTIPAACN